MLFGVASTFIGLLILWPFSLFGGSVKYDPGSAALARTRLQQRGAQYNISSKPRRSTETQVAWIPGVALRAIGLVATSNTGPDSFAIGKSWSCVSLCRSGR